MIFALGFVMALAVAAFATLGIKKLALAKNILDIPRPDIPRKIHKEPMPLLGGLAVILTFDLVTGFFYFAHPLLNTNIPLKSMAAIWIGSLVLAVGGIIDDAKSLPPLKSAIPPLLAALVVVASGMLVPHITNPFGGRILLTGPVLGGIGLVSAFFVLLWLQGMIYTTKFLDGLDGLASGITAIGAIIIFIVSLFWDVPWSGTSVLALILGGSCLGFLLWNFHPAKIFLGEGGSLYLGFMLGVLSVISGSKIATTLLLMSLPIIDTFWLIIIRIKSKKPITLGDRNHLHFQLLSKGLGHRAVVILFCTLSLFFGLISLFLGTKGKIILLFVVFVTFTLLVLDFKFTPLQDVHEQKSPDDMNAKSDFSKRIPRA